jgi:hypothetical protein
MAGARTAARGLSTSDLEAIRDTLAAGRKPKVLFTEAAGQVAGQLGQVVGLTDPEVSDDWVVVRFGRDELPFSPADLSIPPRGAAARRAAPPAPSPELKITQPPVPAPREEPTMPKTTVDTSPPAQRAAVNGAAKPADTKPAEVKPAEAATPAAGEVKPAPRRASKARPKGPAALTVTLSYADGEWMVGATQGSKALAKPYLIKPAEALKMVALLDVPGVHEAVEQIVAAERAEAQAQADRLRAELAEIEQRLAELRDV